MFPKSDRLLDATHKASAILRKGGDCAYKKALRALLPDTQEWWQNYVDNEEYTANSVGLASFISERVVPLCYRQEARHHEAIKPLAKVCKPTGWSNFPVMKHILIASLSAAWPC